MLHSKYLHRPVPPERPAWGNKEVGHFLPPLRAQGRWQGAPPPLGTKTVAIEKTLLPLLLQPLPLQPLLLLCVLIM